MTWILIFILELENTNNNFEYYILLHRINIKGIRYNFEKTA
jgi:hypothetical protein